jgi:signal transduction histidine kinase
VKEAVYRIAQEALHNTVKHAHARHVALTLASADGVMRLDVRDDGQGFDADGDFPGHLGLKSMRERVARVRGTLDIQSAPGMGTHIRALIPTG